MIVNGEATGLLLSGKIREQMKEGQKKSLQTDIDGNWAEIADLGALLDRDLQHIKYLPLEEELRLGRIIQGGLKVTREGRHLRKIEFKTEEAKLAWDALIMANAKLPRIFLGEYLGRGITREELMAVGLEALIKAATTYDPDRGFKFSTYAESKIRQAMDRETISLGRAVPNPVHKVMLYRRIKWRQQQAEKLGTVLSQEELAADLGINPRLVKDCVQYTQPLADLDGPINSGEEAGVTLGDLIEAKIDPVEENLERKQELRAVIDAARARLSEKELEILAGVLGLSGEKPKTVREMAEELGLSSSGVHHIYSRAIEKIRRCPEVFNLAKV